MNANSRNLKLSFIAILLVATLLSIIFQQIILAFAANETDRHIFEYEARYENTHNDYGHCHEEYDILEGYTGSGYNVEEIYLQTNGMLIQPMNATTSNPSTCNSITSSHGEGREYGNLTNFLSTGCSNWRGYSYTYGTTTIPFFMDETNMSTSRAANIRAQIDMWNQAVMHDGTGQNVNLYEVNHKSNINGRPVVVVKQSSTLGDGIAGLFTASSTAPTVQVAASMNVDTPVHEFGHLLGLTDIDTAAGTPSGTHPVLMGYERGTTAATLPNAIKYQDIQGIARINGRHTTHQFDRYIMNGGSFIHFCFYCDTVDDRTSPISGSTAMATASICTHTYQQMVSHGDRHWLKCTKCYNVIEMKVQKLTSTTIQITEVIGTIFDTLTLPAVLSGQTITQIGESAFLECASLYQISIPSSVTFISMEAFNYANIMSVTIPWESWMADRGTCIHANKVNYVIGNNYHWQKCTSCYSTFRTAHTMNGPHINCSCGVIEECTVNSWTITTLYHTGVCVVCNKTVKAAHIYHAVFSIDRIVYECRYCRRVPSGDEPINIWSMPVENMGDLEHHNEHLL